MFKHRDYSHNVHEDPSKHDPAVEDLVANASALYDCKPRMERDRKDPDTGGQVTG